MSTVTVSPGDQVTKDPFDWVVYVFDWDTLLPTSTTLDDVGTFTITVAGLLPEDPITLELDQQTRLTGNRKVQFRVKGGAEDIVYNVAHAVSFNSNPAQKREESFNIWVTQK